MALHTDLPVYASARDLSKLISQVVGNMQKDHKFTLGKRMDKQCFKLLMGVLAANESRDKAPIIRRMRTRVAAIDAAMRLAVDLNRMPRKHYARAILLTASIGKQLTGWLRHSERVSNSSVTAVESERIDDLVAPLPHKGTARRNQGYRRQRP